MLLGPAAFHFPGWICCESCGGGSICAFFKFCLYDKTGLIFKPDTIIINHQLEFSGTRVKHFDHEKRAYKQEIWSYRISEKAYNNRSFWRAQRVFSIMILNSYNFEAMSKRIFRLHSLLVIQINSRCLFLTIKWAQNYTGINRFTAVKRFIGE